MKSKNKVPSNTIILPDGQDNLIGYARTSARSQKEDTQIDDLTAAGCGRIFVDHGVSGKHADRPEFDACLAYLRKGDVLVITRLSRAMRSLQHLLDVVNGTKANDYKDGLNGREIGLKVLKQPIDTTTKEGRLLFHIMAAFDEFLRELIVEGTEEGLAAARARGRVGGRKPKMSPEQIEAAKKMLDERDDDNKTVNTYESVAALFNVDRKTLYYSVSPAARENQKKARRERYVTGKAK